MPDSTTSWWPNFGDMFTRIGKALTYTFSSAGLTYGIAATGAGVVDEVGSQIFISTASPFIGPRLAGLIARGTNATFAKGMQDNFPIGVVS